MGNTKYIGGDKIIPASNCFAIFTSLCIIVPSGFAISFVNFTLLGWIGGFAFSIVYTVSFFNTLRILFLCSRTEPGIIPKIRSKQIEYNKTYQVTYKTPDKVMEEFRAQS